MMRPLSELRPNRTEDSSPTIYARELHMAKPFMTSAPDLNT
ncbi:hypothetical protein [Gemmata palustris]|nr:hypothetical protein [Gemmata palustris]